MWEDGHSYFITSRVFITNMSKDRTTIKIKLLGAPQVFHKSSGQSLAFHKLNLLIFYLVYKASWVSRKEVANLLYPDLPLGKAKGNIRNLLKRLRKTTFSNALETNADNLRLLVANDVRDFQEILKNQNWQEAVEIYTGDFLHSCLARKNVFRT